MQTLLSEFLSSSLNIEVSQPVGPLWLSKNEKSLLSSRGENYRAAQRALCSQNGRASGEKSRKKVHINFLLKMPIYLDASAYTTIYMPTRLILEASGRRAKSPI